MKEMQKTLLVVAFAGLFASAKAQVSVTPEVGISANARSSIMHKWKPAFKVGAAVEFPVSGAFGFQTGLYYVRREFSDITPAYHNASAVWMEHVTVKRHLLQVPLMARFTWRVGEKASVFWAGGAYIGGYVGTSAKRERLLAWLDEENGDMYEVFAGAGQTSISGQTNEEVFKERYTYDRNFDWGVSSSLGVEVSRVVVKAHYDLSLGKETRITSAGPNYHTLSLSVGYKFDLGRLF